MSNARMTVRSRRLAPWLLAAVALICPAQIHAQFIFPFPFLPGLKALAQANKKLSPEVEAKLKEFMQRMTAARGKIYTKRMEEEVQEVVKVTGLDAAKAKSLEKPAAEASEATLKLWSAKAEVLIRKAYGQMGEQSLQVLMQALPQAEQTAHEAFIPNVPKAIDHSLWTDALKNALTPEQAQLWAKHLEERKAKV